MPKACRRSTAHLRCDRRAGDGPAPAACSGPRCSCLMATLSRLPDPDPQRAAGPLWSQPLAIRVRNSRLEDQTRTMKARICRACAKLRALSPCNDRARNKGAGMTRVHDQISSGRARLFELHRQLLRAGDAVQAAKRHRIPLLDDATASQFRDAAIASLKARGPAAATDTPGEMRVIRSKRRRRTGQL